jgi:hypothetical protein
MRKTSRKRRSPWPSAALRRMSLKTFRDRMLKEIEDFYVGYDQISEEADCYPRVQAYADWWSDFIENYRP